MQRMQEGMERPTVGFRFLDADSGFPLREDSWSGESGREDGRAQEESQDG